MCWLWDLMSVSQLHEESTAGAMDIKCPSDCATILGTLALACESVNFRNPDNKLKENIIKAFTQLEPREGLTFSLKLLPRKEGYTVSVVNSQIDSTVLSEVITDLKLHRRCLPFIMLQLWNQTLNINMQTTIQTCVNFIHRHERVFKCCMANNDPILYRWTKYLKRCSQRTSQNCIHIWSLMFFMFRVCSASDNAVCDRVMKRLAHQYAQQMEYALEKTIPQQANVRACHERLHSNSMPRCCARRNIRCHMT